MKVFFHSDNDGRLSAYLVKNHCDRNQVPYEPGDFVEINYNKEFPLDTIAAGEVVWIVDYSLPTETMQALIDIGAKVVWIDHHISAIEKYADFDLSAVEGIRDTRYAACLLTYLFTKHLPVDGFNMDDVPKVVQLVNDWDTWSHSMPDTVAFQSGSELHDLSPVIPSDQFNLWRECYKYEHEIASVVADGKIVMRYKKMYMGEYLNSFGFPTEFEGHKCFALNVGRGGSNWFNRIGRYYPLMACFVFNGEKFIVGLYSVDKTINVADIAKKYGGGGHPGAAGFTCDELPFRKVDG